MSLFHTQVTLDGFSFADFQFTVKLAAGITNGGPGWTPGAVGPTAVIGSPMAWDGTNANQMRIAQPGDEISAKLISVENRLVEGNNVGVVSFKFADLFTIDSAATGAAIPVVGSRVKGGSTAGTVQACTGTEAFFASSPRVAEVRGTQVVCTKY